MSSVDISTITTAHQRSWKSVNVHICSKKLKKIEIYTCIAHEPRSDLAGLVSLSISVNLVRMQPFDTKFAMELQALKILKLDLAEDGFSNSTATPTLTCLNSFGWLAGLRVEHLCLLRCHFTMESFKKFCEWFKGTFASFNCSV